MYLLHLVDVDAYRFDIHLFIFFPFITFNLRNWRLSFFTRTVCHIPFNRLGWLLESDTSVRMTRSVDKSKKKYTKSVDNNIAVSQMQLTTFSMVFATNHFFLVFFTFLVKSRRFFFLYSLSQRIRIYCENELHNYYLNLI